MTSTIEKYFEYAQLAQASYDASSVKEKLKDTDFTEEQAIVFSDPTTGYTLLSHQCSPERRT